jgi:hypothetical protein
LLALADASAPKGRELLVSIAEMLTAMVRG